MLFSENITYTNDSLEMTVLFVENFKFKRLYIMSFCQIGMRVIYLRIFKKFGCKL